MEAFQKKSYFEIKLDYLFRAVAFRFQIKFISHIYIYHIYSDH